MFRKAVATVLMTMKYLGKPYTTTMKPILKEARKEAIKRAENEAYSRMTKRKTAPKKESINSNNGQMTLLF